MATYLTVSDENLWRNVIAGFVGEGYAFDPLATSDSAYLATILTAKSGSAKSSRVLSVEQLLAQLLVTYGVSTASHLTSTEDQLLGALYDAIINNPIPIGVGTPVGLLLLLMKDP